MVRQLAWVPTPPRCTRNTVGPCPNRSGPLRRLLRLDVTDHEAAFLVVPRPEPETSKKPKGTPLRHVLKQDSRLATAFPATGGGSTYGNTHAVRCEGRSEER